MSLFDVILIVVVASLTSLGTKRRLSGFLTALGGLVLFRPILMISSASPFVALLAALAVGFGLSWATRLLLIKVTRAQEGLTAYLGGVGGFLLGIALVLAMVTSLPVERNFENRIYYPPQNLPSPLAQPVSSSRLVRVGRDILLFPLLDSQGGFEDRGSGERKVLQGLHAFFVVGEPWGSG
jgi:hypothetical protein